MMEQSLGATRLFKSNKRQFLINPEELHLTNNPQLISDNTLSILEKNKINFTLSYYDSDASTPDLPIILFLHGNSFSKKVFSDQIKHFSDKYRIIAIDLPGHGDSTNVSNLKLPESEKEILAADFYNPCAMIAEIVQFLEKNNIKKTHIIGWSLGGHIAYGIATENPDLVSSITSIGSPPVIFSSQGIKQGFDKWFFDKLIPEWIANPKFYTKDEAFSMIQTIGFMSENYHFTKYVTKSDPLMRKHLFLKKDDYDNKSYKQSCLDGEHFIYETHLPVTLLVGEKDRGINVDYFKNFTNKLRNPLSKVSIIKDAPHALFTTNKDEFMNLVENFINNISSNKTLAVKHNS